MRVSLAACVTCYGEKAKRAREQSSQIAGYSLLIQGAIAYALIVSLAMTMSRADSVKANAPVGDLGPPS